MVKTLSEGTKLGASIFLDVVPNAPGPDEGHSCRIGFIHHLQKRVDNYYLILRA
jgi:hypothetical protein